MYCERILKLLDQLANRDRNSGSIDVLKSNLPLLIPFRAEDDEDIRNPYSNFLSKLTPTLKSSFYSLFLLFEGSYTFSLKLNLGRWPFEVWGLLLSTKVVFNKIPLLFQPLFLGSCLLCGLSTFFRNPYLAVWLNLFKGCFLWIVLVAKMRSSGCSSFLIWAVKIFRLGTTWLCPNYNSSRLLA